LWLVGVHGIWLVAFGEPRDRAPHARRPHRPARLLVAESLHPVLRALRRGSAQPGDAVAIASYLGSSDRFDRAIAELARGYADLNEKDQRALVDAIAQGRVSVLDGV